MDMSAAALPPIQPALSKADKEHARIGEYQQYRSSMNRLMVEALSFPAWLRQTEEAEDRYHNGLSVVFHTQPGAALQQGWYRNDFAPITGKCTRHGPFETEIEAHEA